MSKFVLAPYVRVGFFDKELHFGFGLIQHIIKDQELQNILIDASVLLLNPCTFDELKNALLVNGYHRDLIEKALLILADRFVIPDGSYNKKHRHSRSLLYYTLSGGDIEETHKKIAEKRIAIVGCGGIGNLMGAIFATSGINQFTLIDSDIVEESNLNRQIMFTENDVGQPKTSSLGRALRMRNSSIKITEMNSFITPENCHCLDNCDFILISGDEEGVVDVVNEYSIKKGIPSINVGYVEDIAVWGPLIIPGKTGCFHCQQHLVNEGNVKSAQKEKCRLINNRYQPPSNGPINMLAASLAALDVLKVLGEFGEPQSLNKRIGLWTHDLHFQTQDYKLNPNCKTCGILQTVNA